ncbi:hypothetical protein GF377_03885 [candidate division GN15 bacterium]|nr:hypothetical protein [candidate division GN15 bacterium]
MKTNRTPPRKQPTQSLLMGLFTVLALLAMASTGLGQQMMAGPQTSPIDEATKAEIIDSVLAGIDQIYVFPDKARQMVEHVRTEHKSGAYDDITDLATLTGQLTEDLRSICHDLHLTVRTARPEELTSTDENREELQRLWEERSRVNNYAFHKVERMVGNIGYLELRGFQDASMAGETAVAAMKFLGNTDALIIDLRQNGGGSPSMIQLLCSYFFDEPTHLNSFYIRQEDTIKQFWSLSFVDGRRMTHQPIYVLTSDYTFSAAEEFTYNLKNLERAMIIGETTGGGAHPIQSELYASLGVRLNVPFGRAINPITGTNWEGTGVTPHIECPADDALTIARIQALDTLSKMIEEPMRRYQINWALDGLKAQREMVDLSTEELAEYTGEYGPRRIWLEDDHLKYQRGEGAVMTLIPMGGDSFMLSEIDFFRIDFERNDDGDVIRLHGRYDQGHQDAHDRTS